jgi:Helix-turn-helix domain
MAQKCPIDAGQTPWLIVASTCCLMLYRFPKQQVEWLVRLMPARLRVLTPDASPWHSFGAELRARRIALGWSQRELGFRVGASRTLISKIETATRTVAGDLAHRCDLVLEARGQLLHLVRGQLPADAGSDPIRPGVVIVGYQCGDGVVHLSSADVELIEACDREFVRSTGCDVRWTIEAACGSGTPGVALDRSGIGLRTEIVRRITRLRARTDATLRVGALALLRSLLDDSTAPVLDVRLLRLRKPDSAASELTGGYTTTPRPWLDRIEVLKDDELVVGRR